MRWASAISRAARLDDAVREAAGALARGLGDAPADLVLAFVSPHHEAAWEGLPEALRRRFPSAVRLGCTAAGVIGDGQEVEEGPALSLAGAHLPDVGIRAFHLGIADLVNLQARPLDWHARLGLEPEHDPAFVLLPDPFTCDAEELVRTLDRAWPRSPKLGGLASGGEQPGANRLFLNEVYDRGAVGVALWGDLQVEPIVAQGCRPVGRPYEVTDADRNVVRALDGRPVPEALEALFRTLDAPEREAFRHSPHLGVVIDPAVRAPRAGDFLVRDVLALDPETGALTVGLWVDAGQVVQFHLRDPVAAAAELRELVGRHRQAGIAAALLFTCLGRGRSFFGAADHDVGILREQLGDVPVAGFFANGEIGPVHARTWLHGYTSSCALIHPRTWD